MLAERVCSSPTSRSDTKGTHDKDTHGRSILGGTILGGGILGRTILGRGILGQPRRAVPRARLQPPAGIATRAARALALWCSVLLVVAAGCAPPQPFVWASRLGQPEEQTATYRIGPGDEIYVLVAEQQALSGTFTVGPDGGYIQPVVGNVVLNGLTTKEAAQQLTARLAGILVRPQVTISVTKRRPIRVNVLGEVQHPGRFELPYEEGILAALASAGGLTEFADKDSIYVVRREPHLLRIRFRMRDLAGPEATSARFRLNDSDVVVVE